MNPQILSLIGIFLALVLVVAGSLRGISIIILSSVAAFLVAATGGVGLLDGYSAYLEGVAGSVVSMFPRSWADSCWGAFWKKAVLRSPSPTPSSAAPAPGASWWPCSRCPGF